MITVHVHWVQTPTITYNLINDLVSAGVNHGPDPGPDHLRHNYCKTSKQQCRVLDLIEMLALIGWTGPSILHICWTWPTPVTILSPKC